MIDPTLVNEAKSGEMRSLGEALCVLCDDIGMSFDDVIEEFEFEGLEPQLAKEAISHGRFNRHKV